MRISVSQIVETLRVVDSLTAGEILLNHGLYSNLQSARVNAQKSLNSLVQLGQLERCEGFYRVSGCRSEYLGHARLVTKVLAEILKLPYTSFIHREITIPEVGLRPDAICLITKDNRGLCFILEVLNHETPEYLRSKINTWKNWEGSLEFLSKLFKYKIPHFDIVVSGESVLDAFEFKSYLKEVI